MSATLPEVGQMISETIAPLGLDLHEPEKFWGVWQFPECRFTHFGLGPPGSGTSWILLCISEAVANAYIGVDAAQNERTRADYEARELTLPEAFEEARSQPLPIVYSTGHVYGNVGGVAVFSFNRGRFCITDLFSI
jgi:hypothetical protein